MIKKYINAELNDVKQKLHSCIDAREIERLLQTYNDLSLIAYDSSHNDNVFERRNIIQLGKRPIDSEEKSFIDNVIKLYAQMPLLETESTKEYPTLRSTKSISADDIEQFILDLYQEEIGHEKISKDQIVILTPRRKPLILDSGKCIVYNGIDKPRLVMERYFSVRELIIPASDGVKLISEFSQSPYSTSTDIAKAYMEYKAIMNLRDTGLAREASKYLDIAEDQMILKARHYASKTMQMDKLSDDYRAQIFNLVNQIIGFNLAQHNNISLGKLATLSKHNKPFSMSDLNTSYDELIEDTAKVYKRKRNTKI